MSEAKNLQTGDTAYTVDGMAVQVIGRINSDWIACELYEDDDGEPAHGRPNEFPRLYSKPPTKLVESRIGELKKAEEAAILRVRALRSELAGLEREHADRMKKFAKYRGIEHLEDFIEGRIEWIVTVSYGDVLVRTKADALASQDRYATSTKLLTLFGGSNGDLAWKINRYSDGSGSNDVDAYPFATQEAANEKAAQLIRDLLACYVDGTCHYGESAIKSAVRLGLVVPEDAAKKLASSKEATARSRVANLEKDLDSARRELAAITP